MSGFLKLQVGFGGGEASRECISGTDCDQRYHRNLNFRVLSMWRVRRRNYLDLFGLAVGIHMEYEIGQSKEEHSYKVSHECCSTKY